MKYQWYTAIIVEMLDAHNPAHRKRGERKKLWRNYVLVRARSASEAYDKAKAHGELYTSNVRYGRYRVPHTWRFVGIQNLMLAYDGVGDLEELFFEESRTTRENAVSRLLPKPETVAIKFGPKRVSRFGETTPTKREKQTERTR
jgi:hypothetical protein